MTPTTARAVVLAHEVMGAQPVEGESMEDVVKVLEQAGFKPQVNVDEDFPPFKGEYHATCTVLRPFVDEQTQEKTAYLATWKIGQTLSGDLADNRTLSRFYRIGGNDFNGNPVTQEAAAESVKNLLNDFFTMGIQLDRTSQEALEASFASGIGQGAFLRAWWFERGEGDSAKKIQQFKVKTERDLRKDSKDGKAGKTERAPF